MGDLILRLDKNNKAPKGVLVGPTSRKVIERNVSVYLESTVVLLVQPNKGAVTTSNVYIAASVTRIGQRSKTTLHVNEEIEHPRLLPM